MQKFRYRAFDRSGETVAGEFDAPDQASAIARLQALGLVPVAAEPERKGSLRARLARDLFAGGRLSGKELADLVQQLSTLIGAGVGAEQALGIMAGRDGVPRMRRAAEDLLRRLRGGSGLAEAMKAAGKTFPAIAVGMVQAGETTGSLDTTLARLSEYLHRSENARQAVYSAMVYPAMLIATAFLSVIIILTVVLPQLEPLFLNSQATLPLATRLIIAVSDALRGWWWAMLLGIGVIVVAVRRALSDPATKLRRDLVLLRVPVLGRAIRQAEAARFTRTLGTLANGNVPLPIALGLAHAVLGNAGIADAIAAVTLRVKEGGGLADPLGRAGMFPELATQLIRIGEATGHLDDMLLKLAEMFDAEVQRTIERSLAMLVPAIMIGLGGVVAAIIASVMAAILGVNDLAV
jgi:general secretion pathway protein F